MFLKISLGMIFVFLSIVCLQAAKELPFEVRFKGTEKFRKLVEEAKKEKWETLPIGERTAAVGRALVETPYKGFTLEIDDHIEAPSVNLEGLDCWTFFETALAFARMLELPPEDYKPETLLYYVELDRYRGGECDGNYLSRLHYLEDWLFDNARGGMLKDLTQELGGVRFRKESTEMSKGWKMYRYLRANRSLIPLMAQHEKRIEQLPVYHIPKKKVAKIEDKLQTGDIIGITTKGRGSVCSHVGLAYRDEKGVLRFMHASSNHHKVILDKRLSEYLYDFTYHAGILVARPLQ